MPPRKEPKEAVVYPASKRKVPAFKPLRPSGVPRIPTTESESSTKAAPAAVKKKKTAASKAADSDDEDEIHGPNAKSANAFLIDDSDEDLDDIEASRPATKSTSTKPAPKRRKTSTREASPMSISSEPGPDRRAPDGDSMPSQFDDTPSIPQPLLIRLLHESFADKNTQIDTEAIQVLQKYVEIFVREAIARTQLEKSEKAERAECAEKDASWLDLEDLEAVAPGLVLDF